MYDIVTIGSATKDVFLLSSYPRVSRDYKFVGFPLGSKIEIDKVIFSTGGGATNSAATFGCQGLKTASLTRLGNDGSAEFILKELKKDKVFPSVIRSKKEKTDYSTILLDSSGERTVLVHYGASRGLKISEIPFDKLKSHWAYIAPGDISFQNIKGVFDHFSKSKTLIAFNPSKEFLGFGLKKLKFLLDRTDVLILNLDESAILTGINYIEEKEIFKKLDDAVGGIVVMTKGSKGVVVSDGKNIYSAGIFPGKTVDRTGAGDAFGSGFVAGLIRKNLKLETWNLKPAIEYAIRLGSANATSVVEKVGAKEGILTYSEFKKDKRWSNLPIKVVKA